MTEPSGNSKFGIMAQLAEENQRLQRLLESCKREREQLKGQLAERNDVTWEEVLSIKPFHVEQLAETMFVSCPQSLSGEEMLHVATAALRYLRYLARLDEPVEGDAPQQL